MIEKNVGVSEQPVRLKMQCQGLDDHSLDSFILKKKMNGISYVVAECDNKIE